MGLRGMRNGEGNEELHNLYRSPNIVRMNKSRRLRRTGHIARMEESRSALGRPRRRWEDNIRFDLEEIGINAGDLVDSTQGRDYWRALVDAKLNLRFP